MKHIINKEKQYILKNDQQRAHDKNKTNTQVSLHCIKVINTQGHEGYLVEYKKKVHSSAGMSSIWQYNNHNDSQQSTQQI